MLLGKRKSLECALSFPHGQWAGARKWNLTFLSELQRRRRAGTDAPLFMMMHICGASNQQIWIMVLFSLSQVSYGTLEDYSFSFCLLWLRGIIVPGPRSSRHSYGKNMSMTLEIANELVLIEHHLCLILSEVLKY